MIYEKLKEIQNSLATISFRGVYSTWHEAAERSKSYEDSVIFERSFKAALAVKEGKAQYERDSVLFYDNRWNNLLLNIYLLSAIKNNNCLKVLDFGGGFGSTYFQHRDVFYKYLNDVKYDVVEQDKIAEYGKKYLEDDSLHFFAQIPNEKYEMVLSSGCIQYIENWQNVIDDLMALKASLFVIERLPVSDMDFFCVEKIGKEIYESSYTMHVYKRDVFVDYITNNSEYKLNMEDNSHISPDVYFNGHKVEFISLIFELE